MIDITQFDVSPSPAACGVDAVIRVVVLFSGPRRAVTVTVGIPGPFTFAPPPSETKLGTSPLAFTFNGRFAGPGGGQQVELTARATSGGESATDRTNVALRC
ncbi:MAG: hypothetical protein HOQ09_00825 [Gemmatimonadaceae bacterium]|nr:hypothetical protein [Gemmatimonadaceae bacterium]